MMGNSVESEQQPRPANGRAAAVVSEALWRHKLLVVGLTLLCAALAAGLSSAKDTRYTAEARVFLSSSVPFDGVGDRSFVNDADRYVVNQAGLVSSDPVLAQAAKRAAAQADLRELREVIDVTPGRDTDLLVIEAEGDSAMQAAARANAVAAAYRSFAGQRVEREAAQLAELSSTPAERAAVLKRAAAFDDGVAVLESADLPEQPSSPNPPVDVLLGLIVGFALGSSLALGLELRRGARARKQAATDAAARRHASSWEPEPTQDHPTRRPSAQPSFDGSRPDRRDQSVGV